MRLVTLSPDIPAPETGGGGNWGASLIRSFSRLEISLTHIAVVGKHASTRPSPELNRQYRELGVDLVCVPYQRQVSPRRSFGEKLTLARKAGVDDLWCNESATRPLVTEALDAAEPDCILALAFDAVFYAYGYRGAPRVGVLCEGPDMNMRVNWRYDPAVRPAPSMHYLVYSLKTYLQQKAHARIYAELVRDLTIAAFQGPRYLDWANKIGARNAAYVTTPTPDIAGSKWRERRAAAVKGSRCRILMIGHLSSTSNRAGLPIFFTEILPALEKEWGRDKFEVRIVGRNNAMPKRYDRWRDHPNLLFCGPVFPPDEEFLACDVLLVPVPAETGMGARVRIINGFSFGCCIVAHRANAPGIPALKHGENALIGKNGRALARLIERAAGDTELRRRLGENGRAAYEKYYSEAVGAEQYLSLLDRAIAMHRKQLMRPAA